MTVSAGVPFRILHRALHAGLRQWFAAALAMAVCSAHGETQVRVMQTDPPAQAELRQLEQQLYAQQIEKRRNEPAPPGAALWLSGFMLAVLGLLAAALAWPAWALWKWRDGWRLAAAIPLLMMGFVVLRIVIDTARDPTSHNLWPLEILMFGTGSIAIMSVLAVMRRLSRRQQ